MGENDLTNLHDKINGNREETAGLKERVAGLDNRLAGVEMKLDRAQWFAVAQLAAVLAMLLVILLNKATS